MVRLWGSALHVYPTCLDHHLSSTGKFIDRLLPSERLTRTCHRGGVDFRVRVMIVTNMEMVSEDGLMRSIYGDGDIVGMSIEKHCGVGAGA